MMLVSNMLPLVQDTTSGAAYVTKPEGPPATIGYMWAGYAVALTVYLAYVMLMARRIKQSRTRLRELSQEHKR